MKLTESEINALLQKLQVQHANKVAKEVKEFKTNPKIIAKANSYLKILEKIPVDIRQAVAIRPTLDMFLNALVQDNRKNNKIFNINNMRSDIVLAMIDSKDLADLCKKLNISINFNN